MTFPRFLLVLGLSLLLAGAASAAPDGKKGKKKKHTVRGVVVAVEKGKDAEPGTITVKVGYNKKNAAATEEKKFTIGQATKLEKVSGKKGAVEHTPATFTDLHKGDQVQILARAGNDTTAQEVAIIAHKKGKKKAGG
jgi:hypothetical protein